MLRPSRLPLSKILVLAIVPIITFLVMANEILTYRYVFLNGGDPMYAYLFNGLTLARGELDIGHTDNPGTTVQTLSAVIVRTVYMFSDAHNITEDVIARPETYLFIARFVQVAIVALLLFALGYKVSQWTNQSLLPAAFLQCSVLTGVHTLVHSHSFSPEGMLMVGGILMILLCMRVLTYAKTEKEIPTKHILLFGVICGFMIITKLPGAIYVFIPLMVIPGIKKRILFGISFLFAAFIFVLPAINRIANLFDFALNVATHSGHYGAGEEKMFSPDEFISNLQLHISSDYMLFTVIGVSVTTIIAGLVQYKTWFRANTLRFKMLIGITLSILANLFLATKHFGYHYLIPSQLLLVLVVYILFTLYRDRFRLPSASQLVVRIGVFVTVLLIPAGLFARFWSQTYHHPHRLQVSEPAYKILFNDKKLPRIYVTTSSTGAGPEPSLYFGYAYSQDARQLYAETINKYYPFAVLYDGSTGVYCDFGNILTPELIATRYPELWFYVYRDSTLGQHQRERFLSLRDSLGPVVTFERVYREYNGIDEVYLMKCDTARAQKLFPGTREFVVDFERTADDTGFYASDSSIVMKNSLPRVKGQAFSGAHSLYYAHANIFSGDFYLPVKPGATYEIFAWRFGEPRESWIVAHSVPDTDFYRAGSASTGVSKNGWMEIVLRFEVPADFAYPNLRVYIYNDDRDDQEMWIDDIRVKEYTHARK